MAQISLICKRTVVGTKPVKVEPGKIFRLSVLDRIMERYHTRIVLYYNIPVEKEAGKITKKLTDILAEVLSSYLASTGRLAKTPEGHWIINCNEAGTRVIEARAEGSVVEWLQNVDRQKELQLAHWEEMFHKPCFWSTLYIQLTEFEEGGLAIGVSCSHLIADPICLTLIIKAWADTTLGGTITSPPHLHPLPPRRPVNINPNHHYYTDLINHYKHSMEISSLPPQPPKNVTTVTLAFSHHMVSAACAGADHEAGLTLTPFEALAGLLWVVISKIKGTKCGLTNMSICLDMRKVLGLDKGFFGDCMIYNKVDLQNNSVANDSLSNGKGSTATETCVASLSYSSSKGLDHNELLLSKAAGLAIRRVIKMMDIEGIIDLIEWLERNDTFESPPLMNCEDLICVNLESVEAYNAMFDDLVKPLRSSYYVEPVVGKGQVLILPSPETEDDGPFSRMVMVTLPANEAIMLCEDPLLMQFSPTILMGLVDK